MKTKIRLVLKQLVRGQKWTVLLFALAFSASAPAQMTEVLEYLGPGCPADSMSSTISPDGSALSLLYDQFSVTAEPATSKWSHRLSRTGNQKWCQIHVAMDIPVGYRLASVHLDQRGFSNLPSDSSGFLYSTLRAYDVTKNHLQFISSQVDYTAGVLQENFNISGILQNQANQHCDGGKQTLTLTTYMGIKLGNNAIESALMTLDSSDLAVNDPNSTDLGLKLERCPRKFRHN